MTDNQGAVVDESALTAIRKDAEEYARKNHWVLNTDEKNLVQSSKDSPGMRNVSVTVIAPAESGPRPGEGQGDHLPLRLAPR